MGLSISLVWAIYIASTILTFVAPTALTGALMRDLRLDCGRALRSARVPDTYPPWAEAPGRHTPHRPGSSSPELWRWLRLRHAVLLDMNRMACYTSRWRVRRHSHINLIRSPGAPTDTALH